MPTPRPAPSCRSCGSFEALPGGELCPACRHAVEFHGASFVDAYAVPCEGCDRPKVQTSPETPTPCRSCGSPACEWPGECKPAASIHDGTHDPCAVCESIRTRQASRQLHRDRLVVK